MYQFSIEKIKEEALKTKKIMKGRRSGTAIKWDWLTVGNIRIYADKVLFLCKEIEKLKKQLA